MEKLIIQRENVVRLDVCVEKSMADQEILERANAQSPHGWHTVQRNSSQRCDHAEDRVHLVVTR